MVPLPQHASVGGIPITDLLSADRIQALIERTRKGGEEILALEKVSSAYYAPAAAVEHMVEAVVRDKKRVLPCVAYLQGEYGIDDIFMGVPVIIGAGGLYDRGDWKGTYLAMNRFMDMLEAREGAISAKAADAIWDFCYEVTPPALHDVKRHKQWWDKTVEWEKFFWEE